MEISPKAIREISKVSFEPTKPFEAVPITQITRELVKKFKEQSKSAVLKQRNNKNSKNRFHPINANNWLKK